MKVASCAGPSYRSSAGIATDHIRRLRLELGSAARGEGLLESRKHLLGRLADGFRDV